MFLSCGSRQLTPVRSRSAAFTLSDYRAAGGDHWAAQKAIFGVRETMLKAGRVSTLSSDAPYGVTCSSFFFYPARMHSRNEKGEKFDTCTEGGGGGRPVRRSRVCALVRFVYAGGTQWLKGGGSVRWISRPEPAAGCFFSSALCCHPADVVAVEIAFRQQSAWRVVRHGCGAFEIVLCRPSACVMKLNFVEANARPDVHNGSFVPAKVGRWPSSECGNRCRRRLCLQPVQRRP